MAPPDRQRYMDLALEAARAAEVDGEVPVGAVVVAPDGSVLTSAGNRTLADNDPSAHAEMLAIRSACQKLGSDRLPEHDLYVTLEPCPMCAAVISFARIRRLYYGASDAKSGGVEHGGRIFNQSTCHHKPEIYSGLGDEASRVLLQTFFAKRRT
jgi:tRNA(adenine34) deaminase